MGIIVALAVTIIPLVIQFASKGDEGSQATELHTVRTAVASMMTANTAETITARLEGASAVITPTETFGIAGRDTMADYMRFNELPTECSYYWDTLDSVMFGIKGIEAVQFGSGVMGVEAPVDCWQPAKVGHFRKGEIREIW